jgi:hypothetical protein
MEMPAAYAVEELVMNPGSVVTQVRRFAEMVEVVSALGRGSLVFALATMVLGTSTAPTDAQSTWQVEIAVSEAGVTTNSIMVFGVHPNGTDNLDDGNGGTVDLGETEADPAPPAGVFDTRWADQGGFGLNGFAPMKLVSGANGIQHTMQLNYTRAGGGNITISWDPTMLAQVTASATITDLAGGFFGVPTQDMRNTSQVMVTNAAATGVSIVFMSVDDFTVPTQLVIEAAPTDATSGAPMSPSLQISAQDDAGNGASGVPVSVSLAAGAGTLTGTLTRLTSPGPGSVATFDDLIYTATTHGEAFAIHASALDFHGDPIWVSTSAITAQMRVLEYATEPAGSVSGQQLTTQPVVHAMVGGEVDPTYSGPITITLASGAGSLSGTTTVNAVNGIAVFTDITYTALAFPFLADGEVFTLQAVDDGTGFIPTTVALTTDVVATDLGFLTHPSGSVSGLQLTTQPVVAAEDANGALDTDFTGTVVLSLATGVGELSGGLTAPLVNGVADDFSILYTPDSDGEAFSLTASSTGLIDGISNPVISDIGATVLVFTTQPSGALNSVPLQGQPIVTAQDANGNTDIDFAEIITLSGTPFTGGGAITGGLSVMAHAGVAQFVDVGWDVVSDEDTFFLTADDDAGIGTDLAPVAAEILIGTRIESFSMAVAGPNADCGALPPFDCVTLTAGLAGRATDGRDIALGERGIPPIPPTTDIFDARFLVPGIEGLRLDLRDLNTEPEWHIAINAGLGGYPVTLSWDPQSLPPANWRIRNLDGSQSINSVMTTDNSLVITDSQVTSLAITTGGPARVALQYAPGWNMASIPVIPVDAALDALFPDALSAFQFSGGYQQVTTLAPCTGYWLNLNSGGTYQIDGDEVAQCEAVLPAAWSLQGVPLRGTRVDDIAESPPNNLLSVFGFEGTYVLKEGQALLAEGQGFWFDMLAAGQVTLDSDPVGAARPIPLVDGYVGPLLWVQSGQQRQEIHLGVEADEVTALPPLPPPGVLDARVNLGHVEALQVPASELPAEYTLTVQGPDVELGWDVPEGTWELVIGDQTVRLAGTGSLFLDERTSRSPLVLRQLGPRAFRLQQNYPNPFNPETAIRYELTDGGPVSLKVYDITGQLVRVLVSEVQTAGAHTALWDGQNAEDGQVSSGVYLYELRAGSFRSIQKMLLMK